MAVNPAMAAEADKFVRDIRQRAYARNISLKEIRWHQPHDPADRTIEFSMTSDGQSFRFAFTLTDLLLFSRGHCPRGETREQRVEALLDLIVQIS